MAVNESQGTEFEGYGRIEEELEGAANQLRERDAVHVVRVRNARDENEKWEMPGLVGGFKDRMLGINASFEYAQGPLPEDAQRYDFSPGFPEGSEFDEERFLSQGEIGVIAEKLFSAISASGDDSSPAGSKIVRLRSGDRLKYVTPDRYVVPAGMRGIWPQSFTGPILLDDLLELAVRFANRRIKVEGDYVKLPEDGDLSPEDQLKEYLNENGNSPVASVLRDPLFLGKGSLVGVGYVGFPEAVRKAEDAGGRSVKYLEGVGTKDDVVVVFYEGKGDRSRVTGVSHLGARFMGDPNKYPRDYVLEVNIARDEGPEVSINTVSLGSESERPLISRYVFREDGDFSEIRVFKLVKPGAET